MSTVRGELASAKIYSQGMRPRRGFFRPPRPVSRAESWLPDGRVPWPFFKPLFLCTRISTLRVFFSSHTQERGRFFRRNPTRSSVPRLIEHKKRFVPGQCNSAPQFAHGPRCWTRTTPLTRPKGRTRQEMIIKVRATHVRKMGKQSIHLPSRTWERRSLEFERKKILKLFANIWWTASF